MSSVKSVCSVARFAYRQKARWRRRPSLRAHTPSFGESVFLGFPPLVLAVLRCPQRVSLLLFIPLSLRAAHFYTMLSETGVDLLGVAARSIKTSTNPLTSPALGPRVLERNEQTENG